MSPTTRSNQLHRLVGEWRGQEVIQSSKWGTGGSANARVVCREELAGKVFVQEYVAERNGQVWLQAHAIYCHQADTHSYSMFWFDSLGFIPQEPGQGEWGGRVLSFIRVSPRGQSRHTYAFDTDSSYEMRLESSFDDDGTTWILVMEGIYVRTNK